MVPVVSRQSCETCKYIKIEFIISVEVISGLQLSNPHNFILIYKNYQSCFIYEVKKVLVLALTFDSLKAFFDGGAFFT